MTETYKSLLASYKDGMELNNETMKEIAGGISPALITYGKQENLVQREILARNIVRNPDMKIRREGDFAEDQYYIIR
ncbi:MAG: hypothetical protein HUJ63_12875 [Enterococcus sp.]|nr:hypothetical protein [Enterococcus sp.]